MVEEAFGLMIPWPGYDFNRRVVPRCEVDDRLLYMLFAVLWARAMRSSHMQARGCRVEWILWMGAREEAVLVHAKVRHANYCERRFGSGLRAETST